MLKRGLIPTLLVVWCLLLWLVSIGIYGCNRDSQSQAHGLDDIGLDSLNPNKPASKEKTNPLAGCLQCHVDVEAEHLGSKHYRVLKTDCIDCHGPSEGHVADEINEVKPEETFARKDTDRLCNKCHKCSRKVTPSWTKTPPEKRKVCTDCHAAHRFANDLLTSVGQ